MTKIETENGIVKRDCWACDKEIQMSKELYNKSKKRLCDECIELRQAVKGAENGLRSNKEDYDWNKGKLEDRKLFYMATYTIVKLQLLEEKMKEKGLEERFEKIMTLPDKEKPKKIEESG